MIEEALCYKSCEHWMDVTRQRLMSSSPLSHSKFRIHFSLNLFPLSLSFYSFEPFASNSMGLLTAQDHAELRNGVPKLPIPSTLRI